VCWLSCASIIIVLDLGVTSINFPVGSSTTKIFGTCDRYEVLMGLLYGLGALVYATRVPERWMPGKFDIAGHSHQLFHVLVVAGAYTHYHAGLVYLKWRDLEGC
jgi:predicted membrane channel-forming protein YqfA (hemolysin III family)